MPRNGQAEAGRRPLHWSPLRALRGTSCTNSPSTRSRNPRWCRRTESPIGARAGVRRSNLGGTAVAVVSMKQLLEAGVHFGHQTRRWNPKMRRFIFGERNGIYIVDLHQTLDRIDGAYRFVRVTVAGGGTVLFVGTKKQAQEPVERQAAACGMPYVNFRWLGGMLTNFQTVHSRVAKLRELQRTVDSGDIDQMP